MHRGASRDVADVRQGEARRTASGAALICRRASVHHLLPSDPYHALGAAHRRLSKELGGESSVEEADYRTLLEPLRRMIVGKKR